MKSFYNPLISYEQNFDQGPFGEFANPSPIQRKGLPQFKFLDQSVYLPFGIPAGPLINSNFIQSAFKMGFDLCVYKTVRSKAHPCHQWPNVLPVEVTGDLSGGTVKTKQKYELPLSITNSFGVPSPDPDWWQQDMAQAVKAAGIGQVLIASFQGTSSEKGNISSIIEDYGLTAKLVAQTGAKVMVANLSCPNEGKDSLLCFDVDSVKRIAFEVKEKIGDIPLLLKLAYFKNDEQLKKLVSEVGPLVQGFIAINTIPCKVVDDQGNQALPGRGREISGICGSSIKWAGLDMTRRLKNYRQKFDLNFAIVGVGGVTNSNDYSEYLDAGADAVLSATGAMWQPDLAKKIYQSKMKEVHD